MVNNLIDLLKVFYAVRRKKGRVVLQGRDEELISWPIRPVASNLSSNQEPDWTHHRLTPASNLNFLILLNILATGQR